MASRAVRLYNHQSVQCVRKLLETLFSRKYLLYTNTTISVLMSCAGDGLQQKYQISKQEIVGWDRRRSRDVGITGLVIGPFCHYWYLFLDWWLPGKTIRIVTKKLLVDQLLCSPVTIFSFLSLTSYLEGNRGKELKNEIITKGKTLYKAEWFIWPPAQMINFYLLPTKYRVLFDNAVSFGFDWYFSYVKYGKCTGVIENSEKELLQSTELVHDNEVMHISEYGPHLPFLHIQAASLLESKIGNYHWDNWSEWFYVKCPTSNQSDSGAKDLNVDNEIDSCDTSMNATDDTMISVDDIDSINSDHGDYKER